MAEIMKKNNTLEIGQRTFNSEHRHRESDFYYTTNYTACGWGGLK